MKKLQLLFTTNLTVFSLAAQITATQYFDGSDIQPAVYTLDSGNVWQVGAPQKTLFNAPASTPNVLITDTVNACAVNANASVVFPLNQFPPIGIMAMQWKQKFDLDSAADFAFVEYTIDNGVTWQNCFNNPYVYNFYGYDSSTVDTSQLAFTGRDTSWRDVWLCFDAAYLIPYTTTFQTRFRIVTDSVSNNREGWMIDNYNQHLTIFHTAGKDNQPEYLRVYPTPSTGIVNIEAQKLQEYHIIEGIEVISADGKLLKQYGVSPTKFWIDLSAYPNGTYYLRVITNKKTETHKVILQR
ncbi:MAG: T9SS type A sorting domain-containing protein [Bacteroidetes bacterium]|nr:T9SS type A sorting domain-containing protein [Bacteroidota bacterium]